MAPYTHPDFAYWAGYLQSARDGYSRPIANNTRVHWVGEDAVAIRLHATDVVTILRDGTRRLATGGWQTVTTKDRISGYGSRHVVSEGGYWFVQAEDDPDDPHPLGYHSSYWSRASRTIPKPFRVPDPGPEPVDDGAGCVAGTREEFIAEEYERVYDWRDAPAAHEFVTSRYYPDGSGPCQFVHRARLTGIAYGESARNTSWGEDWDKQVVDVPTGWDYKRCPHCAAFAAKHKAWDIAYDGKGWGRGAHRGYRQMCEHLERFGDFAGWQAAYIEEFREVREVNRRVKAWRERNLIPFYNGITVTPLGFAPLKAKKKWCRELREIERERRRQARVHARVRREQARIQAKFDRQRKREREVKRQIAHALAESVVFEMDATRREGASFAFAVEANLTQRGA